MPLAYALIMMIMSLVVHFNPGNFRLSYTNPATVSWFSMMLLLDSIQLILSVAVYREHLKSLYWIFGGVPMTCISIAKIALYFSSFVCLLANPVADTIGAMTALIASFVLIAFLATRYFYLKKKLLP